MTVSISIIIPVYNASKYLKECLESVLAQTFLDLQIICINDGSTDDSLNILKEFQKKDSRIVLIDQKNQGVSAARNAGLEIAKGKYIGFVDGDDTVDVNYFDFLWKQANSTNADVVYSSLFKMPNLISGKSILREDFLTEILPEFFRSDDHNSVCNKIFRSEIIKNNHLKFSPKLSHGEDAEFNIKFLLKAERVIILNYFGYYYRQTDGSATRNAAKFNYLQNAVDTFEKDWPEVTSVIILSSKMHELKKERFINNIISQIYIYAVPTNGLSIKKRLRKLTEIISNETVIQLFSEDNSKIINDFHRYQMQIYKAIQAKSLIKLYLLSLYSYYRNQ